MNFGFDWPRVSEKTFGECGRRTDRRTNGRTTAGRRVDVGICLFYKLRYKPKGSGELIKLHFKYQRHGPSSFRKEDF